MNQTRLETSYRSCRDLARRTARNFYLSFRGLPADHFDAMCALYAFLRLTDDLVDAPGPSADQRAGALDDWRDQLQRAASGCPLDGDDEVFPALADTIARYQIPTEYLVAVLDGVEMDLAMTGYETFAELERYCHHVAGAVGGCCIHVWGFHDPRAIATAMDCGTAFQLTNILRDLAEDIDMQRVYLPAEDLDRFGYTVADLAERRVNNAFRRLMQFEVDRAWSYYRRAEALFEYLEPRGRPILRAMLKVYTGLLGEIERRDGDVFTRPVRLPAWRKLLIAADAMLRRRWTSVRGS